MLSYGSQQNRDLWALIFEMTRDMWIARGRNSGEPELSGINIR